MNALRNGLSKAANETVTENGAYALKSTRSKLLDFYATAGSIRTKTEEDKAMIFEDAFIEDPLRAVKALFYTRDIREGLGERQTFRIMLKWLAEHHPETVLKNIELIPFYGRWDDLYCLIDTPVEDDMWQFMRKTYDHDIEAMEKGEPVSLMAKWVANDTSGSKNTEKLGVKTINKMGFRKQGYVTCSKNLKRLRKYLDIPEIYIAAKEYEKIEYEKIASRALRFHKGAFEKNDKVRFNEYVSKVSKGEAKLNAKDITPRDLMFDLLKLDSWSSEVYLKDGANQPLIENQWKNLKDYSNNHSAITILDTSGSMTCGGGEPLLNGLGLTLYMAERNKGPFANCFITFSNSPEFIEINPNSSLFNKCKKAFKAPWNGSTNIESALDMILTTAEKNKVSPEDMPEALVIVSDMQFNICSNCNTRTYTDIYREKFERAGYKMPNIIYWNVNAKTDAFQAKADDPYVQFASGSSVNTFKSIMNSLGRDPYTAMLDVLDSDRYSAIEI